MERNYEEAYPVFERRHPWFVARRELFATLAGPDRRVRILDVGTGTGIFLSHLKALGFESLAGVEPSRTMRSNFRDENVEILPELPDGRQFDKVFLLDVLEHIEDDRSFLAEVYERVRPGGSFYVSVPAHPFLWGHHDVSNRHFRRYRRRELAEKLAGAGFRLRKLSYWNMFFFPAVCLLRWLKLGEDSGEFDLGNPLMLALVAAALRLENRLVQHLSLPIGVSLIAVAERDT